MALSLTDHLLETEDKRCPCHHCGASGFLPRQCVRCHHMFCEEHFGVEDHSCASDLAGDRVVIVSCPVCAKAIRVEVGQNPDAVMEAHIGGKCKGPKSKRKDEKEKASALSCSFKGCRDGRVGTACVACDQYFCVRHRYPDDHGCTRSTTHADEKKSGEGGKPSVTGTATTGDSGKSFSHMVPEGVASVLSAGNPVLDWYNVCEAPILATKKGEDYLVLGVHFPPQSPLQPRWMGFSPRWSMGRVLDAITSKNGLIHKTNEAEDKRWHLFSVETGDLVTPPSAILADVLAEGRFGLKEKGTGLLLLRGSKLQDPICLEKARRETPPLLHRAKGCLVQ